MPNWLRIFVFLLVAFAIAGSVHYYLLRRLLTALGPLGGRARNSLRVLACALALSFPAARVFGALAGPSLPTTVANWIAVIWLGLALYLFLATLALHFLAFLLGLTRLRPTLTRLTRGQEGRIALATVVAITLGFAIQGLSQANAPAKVSTVEIPLQNLPPALNGFTIVHISDLHIGVVVNASRLARVVQEVNALKPDLVVITGDLVDEDASYLRELIAPLQKFQARYGVLASTGNHDFFAGVEDVVRHAAAGHVRFLRNESVLVADGIRFWGLDDPMVKHLAPKHYVPMDQLLAPVSKTEPNVLLYHQPLQFDKAARLGIDLMLSGHTHGGQLWPLRYISRRIYPRNTGLFQLGHSFLYVSRGTGTWGPPMRIGATPEITRIKLNSVPKS